MHKLSRVVFCSSLIFTLSIYMAFANDVTHAVERAMGVADQASGQNTPPAKKPPVQDTNSNSTGAVVSTTLLLDSTKVGTNLMPDSDTYSPATEIRAIWITRGNYKTADDIKKIADNCAKYNINMMVFQVRGNGTVFYKSKIEPWAKELTGTLGQDPGWDPLQVAVDEAHKHKLKLVAWLNTMPGWTGKEDPPANVPQLWNTHREWFMCDTGGNIMIPKAPNEGWYRFISPTIPEVQDYIASVYSEVVRNYKVDGIHFDYVRYPGEIGDFSYDSISLALFKQKTGGSPFNPALKEEWSLFRRDGIAAVVTKTYNAVTAINPKILVTAAVIGDASRARSAHYTSSRQWFNNGVMDITMTMGYTADIVKFRTENDDHIKNSNGRFVCPGIGVGGNWCTTPQMLGNEIRMARNLGGQGVTFFAYNGLFPQHQPNELAEFLLQGPFSNPSVIPDIPWKK